MSEVALWGPAEGAEPLGLTEMGFEDLPDPLLGRILCLAGRAAW